MATEAKSTNYWISSTALYIQLNAMGESNYIQCSVVSGASVLCYMSDVPGLGYDAGHNYQRWTLAAYPSIFPDSARKYVYIAIPRQSTTDNNQATVVFPGQKIDIYGKTIPSSGTEGVQIGNEAYYYIFTGGIISAVKTDADNTRKREWEQHFECGKLATDEAIASGGEGAWWRYNSVSDTITFLKEILNATFNELSAKVARVTSLFLGGHELKGVADSNGTLETSNDTVVTPQYLGLFGVKHFLAKDKDDTVHGTITWEKVQKFFSGLHVGNSNNENGGSWTTDAEGRSHLITDYLEVRMKAIFEELVINKTSTIGGKEIISPAGGVVAHKVEEVTVTYNNVSQKAYRCYFLAEQDGDEVDNDFAVNDQVRSESFNVRKGTYHKAGNHFYWRLVIGRDEEPVELEGKKYHYIDLSDTDCATASDVPAKGDVLNQCGNRTDVERQNCLIFSAVDTYSPSISLYHGINSYSFANREYVEYGVNKQNNKAFFNVYGDMYVGDRPTKENGYEGSSYIRYDSSTKQVSVKGKISAKSTVDGKELSQYFKKIADLQNQVDGAIETWFYEGVPTLENAPAISWKTDKDKEIHLGDLYYDNKTGKAYRFAKDSNTYKWTIITDTDIAKALSDARMAQETANGKMKVFCVQPTTPYQVGDIWVNATYPSDGSTYKNEVLRCQTNKAAGSQFAIGDWIKASKYTDDTVANAAKKAAEDAQKAALTAQTDIKNLGKTVTDNKKEFDNYVTDGYLEPSEIAAMAQDSKRLEDDFAAAQKSYNEVKEAEVLKNTKELTDLKTAFATLTTAKTELVTYLSDISKNYNKADTNGKATIVSAVGTKFTNFQSAYSAFYDKLGLANAYITRKIYGDLGVVIGDVSTYQYLKKVLADGVETEINGGLILTNLIALRDPETKRVESGINGVIDKTAKGNGIATWWGGYMNDGEVVGFDKKEDYSKQAATSLVRFDGSGYMANGAIWWGTDGKVHADPTSFIISEKNLGAYLTFFEPTWKAGSTGTSVADLVSLKPNAPFSKLGVSGDATFEGAISFHGIKLTYDSTNKAIKIDGNLYATGGITAYGAGASTTGGGGLIASVISYARILEGSYTDADLTSIPNAYAIKALSSRIDNIATELGGLNLSWNNITGKPSTFAPSAHTHKWTEITDRITKVSQLTNDAGYLTAHQSLASYYTKAEIDAKGYTTNKGTVTSVALTLPTGLTCATKIITTSGTFAISLASGYSIPTTAKQTAWDGAVSAKHTHSNKSVLDGISSAKVTHWDSAYDWYALMTTDEETADGIINKWNEVVSFLANIAQTDTLSGIVDGINKSISDEVTRAKKAEGVNASGISTNKTNITTLQGYFTSGSAKKALQLTNARKLWGNSFNGTSDVNGSIIVPNGKYISIGNIKMEYDATNKALKITNTTTNEVANLYTSGGVSAYGVGTSSSSGGGLNGSVKSYADALKLTSESLSEIASAYSIKALDTRISSLEGGSATAISVSGSGNAVTAISKSGTTIIVTKGTTFLTSHQSLASYLTRTDAASLYQPKGNYLTSHQSLANYYTKSETDSKLNGYLPLSGGTMQANARITHGDGNLYIGNTNNRNWLAVQDICSQSSIGDGNWSIRVDGTAHFQSIKFPSNRWISQVENGSNSPLKGIKLPNLQSNAIGIFSRVGNASDDEGGIILSEDTCVIYNSFDTGWGLSVRDKDLNQTDISSDDTVAFGIRDTYKLYSRGGFEKKDSSDDYVLLGGGGHSKITDLSVSNADTVDGYHATSGRTFDGNINWSPNWNDVWSDGTNTHPWYGFDHRYPNTGAYSTTITDYFGMTIKTANTLRLDFGTLLLNGTDIHNINVASATKLATARSIWGQSFDGTGNVDGTLRIKDTTSNYREGIRIQNPDNTWCTIALGGTSNEGTGINCWSIHRKSDNNFCISRNSSDGVNGLVMTSTGMGLGTTAPAYRLDVRGDIYSSATIRTAAQNRAIMLTNDANPAWISALEGQVIFNTGKAIRFGETAWDWNQWAGLKYTHSNKTIYLGIADGSAFNANSAQSDGTLRLAGIKTITPDSGARIGNSGADLYLGNASNSAWVKVQDICSQTNSSLWSIRQDGNAYFKSININSGATFNGPVKVNNMLTARAIRFTTADSNVYGTSLQNWDGSIGAHVTNMFNGIDSNNISVEYSTNGGSSWLTYTANPNYLFNLINDNSDTKNFFLGNNVMSGSSDADKLTQIKKNQLRVTIKIPPEVYQELAWISVDVSNGVDIKCQVYFGNSNGVYTEYVSKVLIGWSHRGDICIGPSNVNVGNDSHRYVRLVFSHLSSHTVLRNGIISRIRALALTKYNNGSGRYNISTTGHIYNYDYNMNTYFPNSILAKGGVTAYQSSDIRLKQDLRKLDYFGIIKAMGGTFGFAWKKDNTRSIGWIAQHVLCNPHLKDIVETDEKGYYKINYWSPKLIATAFGAIEQVGDEVSRLKARVVFLESEVQRLSGDKDGNNKKRLDNKNINSLN